MRDKAKKIVGVFMLAVLALAWTLPIHTRAELPGFSGYPVYSPIPCTCSDTLWSFFAPLYLSMIPMAGPMVYVPYATIPYPYEMTTVPDTSHFGAYIPGVQACWMYIGYGCIVWPSVGAMMYVSTGIPGASSASQ